jgi:uncharacterized protein YkwD
MRRLLIPLILLIIVLLAFPSCAKTVPQQEYDKLKTELNAIQKQLETKSAENDVIQAQFKDLNNKYSELNDKYGDLNNQYQATEAKYKDLNGQYEAAQAQYKELNGKYEAIQAQYKKLNADYTSIIDYYKGVTQRTSGINETDLEQALFKLINQERVNNHLAPFMWGELLYGWAKINSHDMSINQRYQYSNYGSYEQVYWAAGYGTAESIASATLNIWKNSFLYEKIFLNPILTYATVAVYKSGEILYITYISDVFK